MRLTRGIAVCALGLAIMLAIGAVTPYQPFASANPGTVYVFATNVPAPTPALPTPALAAPVEQLPAAPVEQLPAAPVEQPAAAPQVVYVELPTPEPQVVYVEQPPQVVYVEQPPQVVVEQPAATGEKPAPDRAARHARIVRESEPTPPEHNQ